MGANLTEARLSGANLSGANLENSNFSGAKLNGAIFSNAVVGNTIFGNLDLNETEGLDEIRHRGPSRISTDLFSRSKGNVSETFLRGCGLSDWEIEEVKLYNPNLSNEDVNRILYKIYDLRATQALQISPLFISYNHADSKFVDKLVLH